MRVNRAEPPLRPLPVRRERVPEGRVRACPHWRGSRLRTLIRPDGHLLKARRPRPGPPASRFRRTRPLPYIVSAEPCRLSSAIFPTLAPGGALGGTAGSLLVVCLH